MDKKVNKRRKITGKKTAVIFVNIALVATILVIFMNTYSSTKIVTSGTIPNEWEPSFLIFQFSFAGIILIFIVTIFYLLNRGLGALTRIERILDKIIEGEYSLRINIRKGDIMRPLTERFNKILDMLEEKKTP